MSAIVGPNETSTTTTTTTQSSVNDETRPRRPARERLQRCVLRELWSIWRANPRVPSVKSRRLWAISRNANPRSVDSWFLRRKTCAKKAGQPVPGESYDLALEPPACAPEREESTTPIEPILDLPSDDTLVYPPDIDDLNDIEASSDTVFDGKPKATEAPALKKVPVQLRVCPEYRSKLRSSSADLYTAKDCGEGNILIEGAFLPVYDQDQEKRSDFTRILCSDNPVQVEVPFTCGTTSESRGDLFISYPRLDFLPDTLSELSAVPFLFRTPSVVPSDNAAKLPSVENWSIVEDELGRLVKDGKLDLSFLDAPHLSSMELVN